MGDPVNKKPASPLYLGLDFSTQQLKAVCIDNQLKVVHESSVVFDTDLQQYKTEGGVHKHDGDHSVTAPTIMWVEALDVLLCHMQSEGFPFSRLAGISGSGQQHGSVYWRRGSEATLAQLSPGKDLAPQLKGCFSVEESPVWMDSSTTVQCQQLEKAVGGAQQLASHTGSRAYERFTGNQIARIYQNTSRNEAFKDYPQTERISLVSSFGASLLLGKYAEIDYSDGSGMNLMDIGTKDWWQEALDACAPDLRNKLGKLVPTNTVLGNVSSYYVERYGFSSECKVSAFTGDNPASLAGMRLEQGDVVISLGTSDTLFLWIDQARPQLMGHVFVNPVNKEAYMALLCYKNGSRTREIIRDNCANGKWEEFDRLLDQTEPGNKGNIGIYFTEPEITPSGGHGDFRLDQSDEPMRGFPEAVEVRAVLEGQIMAKLFHARSLGYEITSSSRILVTGGGATNNHIRQVIADIFNAKVYTLAETANSASLGAAYCAKRAVMMEEGRVSFEDVVRGAPSYELANTPRPGAEKIYKPLIERYAKLEKSVASSEIQ